MPFVIDGTTVMGQAVAHNQIVGMKGPVIGGNLFKNSLVDGDRRGLVFHNDKRMQVLVVQKAIATPYLTIEVNHGFIDQALPGIAFFSDQVIDKMLSDPFFRCQSDVTSSEGVKDLPFSLYVPYFIGIGRQVYVKHFVFLLMRTKDTILGALLQLANTDTQ